MQGIPGGWNSRINLHGWEKCQRPLEAPPHHPRPSHYLTLYFYISVCSNTFSLVIKSWFSSHNLMSYLSDKNSTLQTASRIWNHLPCCYISAGRVNVTQFVQSWIPASCESISAHLPLRWGYPTVGIMLQGSGVSTEPAPLRRRRCRNSSRQSVVWSSKLTPF